LLGLLDAIWSNVRGIDAGLLPTAAQIEQLQRALIEGKQLWLVMKIQTLQPKWHMTFDGHLLDQVMRCGGLADKADDTIVLQHQILKKLRDRHRNITSFQRRESCVRRELRHRKSSEMQSHVDQCESSIKLKKRRINQVATADHHNDEREAKRMKREAAIDG